MELLESPRSTTEKLLYLWLSSIFIFASIGVKPYLKHDISVVRMMRSVLYFMMGIIYSVHFYQVHMYTCVDSAAIIMTTLQVIIMSIGV